MDANELARIRALPAFQELTRKRSSFGWSLAVLMFAIYGSFILLVAFAHDFVAQPIGVGPLTLAFPLGLGVIVLAIVLTGVYVVRANGEFDRLTAEIVGRRFADGTPVGARLVGAVR